MTRRPTDLNSPPPPKAGGGPRPQDRRGGVRSIYLYLSIYLSIYLSQGRFLAKVVY